MNPSQLKEHLLRTTAVAGLAAAFSLSAAAPVFAQDADEAAAADEDRIIVFGTRIQRPGLEANSPISVVDSEELRFSGTVNVDSLISDLPSTLPGFTDTSNNPGTGTATADLRGLGAVRTLVLVDGKRVPRFDPRTPGVDLNTIPASLVERIEVITGGASAVYGSDAVAGAINFVLKKDFEGVQFDFSYHDTDKFDAQTYDVSALMGMNSADGRGNVTMHLGYTERKDLFQGERDFSRNALFDNFDGTLIPLGSGTGVPGEISFVNEIDFTGVHPDLLPDDDGLFTATSVTLDPSGVAKLGPDPAYNYAPVNYLRLPQKRYAFTAIGHYDLTDWAEFYGKGTYTNSQVPLQLAPTPFNEGPLLITVDNPLYPASLRAVLAEVDANEVIFDDMGNELPAPTRNDGVATVASIGRRMIENGNRAFDSEIHNFQILAGFRGDIPKTDGRVNYDAYYAYGRSYQDLVIQGDLSVPRIEQALLVEDDGTGTLVCTNPANDCVPVNLLGPVGTITPEMVAFFTAPLRDNTIYTQQIGGVTFNGLLPFTSPLAKDEIGWAAGFEWRNELAESNPDDNVQRGFLAGFNASPRVAGETNVYEYFLEANVPLVQEKFLVHDLVFEAGFRHSDYDLAGGVQTYKYGGSYAPVQDIRFRGMFQRAIRAPDIGELFTAPSENFPTADDPCAAENDPIDNGIQQLCVDTGVPFSLVDGIGNDLDNTNAGQARALFRGNTDLTPEIAETVTVGFVLQPRWVPGLTIQFDYYDIEIEDAITTLAGSADNLLNTCYNVVQDADSIFCQAITRTITGLLNPKPGFVDQPQFNSASIVTEGFDLQVDYEFSLDELGAEGWGNMKYFFLGTHVDENTFVADVVAAPNPIDCAGLFGPTCGRNPNPHYVFVQRLTWLKDEWSVSLRHRYIGASTFEDFVFSPGFLEPGESIFAPNIEDFHYLDVTISYAPTDSLVFTLGSNNVLNQEVPLVGGDFSPQANTFPGTYDVFREIFFSARKKF